jgi:ectoine hydroxylase-related dioxygenase (phytanoyl-CoA dioxygenase family)
MTDREKYLFDLQGFLVIKDVLTEAEVARLNAALDANWDQRVDGGLPPYTSDAIEGERKPQGMINGMLTWPSPHGEPFHELLAHPNIVPHLNTLLGRGWHMDMEPHLFHSVKGTRGQVLHGGYPHFNGGHYYHYHNGLMRNGMLVVEFLLTDQNAGEGGFMAIPGSHKSNYLRPKQIATLESDPEIVVNPGAKAGDVILFTEALGHGALPWTAAHERRVLLYRYSPKTVGFGAGFVNYQFPEWTDRLTEAQRAVLEPAYKANRPLIDDNGEVEYPTGDIYDVPAFYDYDSLTS